MRERQRRLLPWRSSHTNALFGVRNTPGTNTSEPVADALNCAAPVGDCATPSSTGTPAPVTVPVARSNGTAISVPAVL
jgi:hypothetical protein